jgi:hypothetical protein
MRSDKLGGMQRNAIGQKVHSNVERGKEMTAVLTHKTHHPVAKKASALANRSAIVKAVNPIRQAIAAMMPSARRPCKNRTKVGKAVDFFGVAVKS